MDGAYAQYDAPALTPPRRYTEDEHDAEHEGAIVHHRRSAARDGEGGKKLYHALSPLDDEREVCVAIAWHRERGSESECG